MEDAVKVLKKTARRDRVNLDPVSITRLNEWTAQLSGNLVGMRVSRGDLVNFIIGCHAPALSVSELGQLRERYFDEVEFAAQALKELKKARGSGQKLSLQDIISSLKPPVTGKQRKKRKAVLLEAAVGEVSHEQ